MTVNAFVEEQAAQDVLRGRLLYGFRAVCHEPHPELPPEPFIPRWQGELHLPEEESGAWFFAAIDAKEHRVLVHGESLFLEEEFERNTPS